MEQETANKATGGLQPPSKLSRLQKLILTDLYEQYEAYLKYIRKYRAWAAKYTLEMVIYAFAINSKGLSWRIAQKYDGKTHISRDEAKAAFNARKAEVLTSVAKDTPQMLGFVIRMWNRRRYHHAQLLPAFRASMSKSLKRLEARGLITREKGAGQDWRSDNRKPKTTGIYLTPRGLEVARQLSVPGMLAVSAQEKEADE